MVERLISRKGGRLDLDGAYDYFDSKVKQDCAEGAALFDTGQDGYRSVVSVDVRTVVEAPV